jgi:hypothetical protein
MLIGARIEFGYAGEAHVDGWRGRTWQAAVGIAAI